MWLKIFTVHREPTIYIFTCKDSDVLSRFINSAVLLHSSFLICIVNIWGKVSAQLRTIVKQICSPNGNVLFSLFKNWMHNVGWSWAEILPHLVTIACVISWRMLKWQDFRNSGHSKLVFNNYNSCLLLLFFNLHKELVRMCCLMKPWATCSYPYWKR